MKQAPYTSYLPVSWLLLLAFGMVLSSACTRPSTSKLNNTFDIDESDLANGNTRRHKAGELEAVWTVFDPKGCSAILLDAAHILTAAHCEPSVDDKYTSGLRALSGLTNDLVVRKVLEKNTSIDYAILEVEWLTAMPEAQKFPPYVATSADEVLIASDFLDGDWIFTAGFPMDKRDTWPVTYAEGQAKALVSSTIGIDIGVINGTSGAGVLKKDNNMLVGIVIRGSKNFGDAGWNNNDVLDPSSWNDAVPSWEIYAVSPVMKSIYPAGKHLQLGDKFTPRTRIYLGVQASDEQHVIWASTGFEADSVLLCPGVTSTCKSSSSGVEKLTFQNQKQDRKFFRTRSGKSALHLKTYSLAAYDKSGRILAKRQVKLKQKD